MQRVRRKAYIYPITARDGGIVNPYIYHFIEALEDEFEFLNRDKPSYSGIFDLLKYFTKIRYLFLNWPEDIPGKKGGVIQLVFFVVLILFFKLKKVKIVWTLHNRESH